MSVIVIVIQTLLKNLLLTIPAPHPHPPLHNNYAYTHTYTRTQITVVHWSEHTLHNSTAALKKKVFPPFREGPVSVLLVSPAASALSNNYFNICNDCFRHASEPTGLAAASLKTLSSTIPVQVPESERAFPVCNI